MVKFIDLFAGTGGIRLGFQKALAQMGVASECVKSAEIDKRACHTYSLNFGEDPYCDVTQLEDIPGGFDVLLAGFPCQAFSSAGKQMGFADTRGTLFFEVERLLAKYRPKLCFLENVRGLTTHDNGRTFKVILERLVALGYKVEYRLLNSSDYGVPQNRVRIYIIASLEATPVITLANDVGASDSHQFKSRAQAFSLFETRKSVIVRDILEDNPDPKYDCSEWFTQALEKVVGNDFRKLHGVRLIDTRHGNSIHSWDLGLKGDCSPEEIAFMNQLVSNRRRHTFGTHQDGKALTIAQIQTFYPYDNIFEVIGKLTSKGYLKNIEGLYNLVCGNMSFEVFKFLDPDSISITLTASDTHKLGVFHKGRLRRLSPRECARLQGYPDDYRLNPNDTYAYKQLGNAVSVPVVQQILSDYFAHNTISFLEKEKLATAISV